MTSNFPILRYFEYGHLPEPQRTVAKPFHDLAHSLVDSGISSNINNNPAELAAGLRKLLEAKDCMVRASLERL